MKKKTSKLVETLKELTDALEASEKEAPCGNSIEVIDLSLAYNTLFSPASKRGMERKVDSLTPKRKIKYLTTLQTEVHDKVVFFARTAIGEENIYTAAKWIAAQINSASAQGYVTGSLAPLACLRLVSEPHELGKYAVFCYVAMTADGAKSFEKESCPEGSIPLPITEPSLFST